MRVTQGYIANDILRSVNQSRERIVQLQKQLASQKRIQKPSDDPSATNAVMRLNTGIDRIDQFKTNASDGKSMLDMTTASLDSFSKMMTQLRDTLTKTSNGSDQSARTIAANALDQMISQGMTIANTSFNGKYIFGGSQTQTPPYALSAGPPQTVAYAGNTAPILYEVGEGGMTQQVNVSGADAFTTATMTMAGNFDSAAAVGATFTTNDIAIADAAGASHNVRLTYTKTGANTWGVTTVPGTGASLNGAIAGGSGTITFDPTTGALSGYQENSPLTLSPASGASSLTVNFAPGAITQNAAASNAGGTGKTETIFDRMAALRDTLRSGGSPTQADLNVISSSLDTVMLTEAKAGSLYQSLDNVSSYLDGQKNQLLALKDVQDGVNIAEVTIQLKQEQTMLDAALSVGAQLIPKSLLDYLK